jgi:A/G-specific adenine glycosylase
MSSGELLAFQEAVWDYYRREGRHDLPWRQAEPDGSHDPFKILVSEIMLQQTQVARVIPKYLEFTARFPSFAALAKAPLADVLVAWSGLGYNRRAKFLWQAAKQVVQEHGGHLPDTTVELSKLPGIGPNTAGAVLAYAHNKPVVFIETNIRTVYIHHFFADRQGITDREILDMVARTLPDDARTWYWALMDYGTYLKQTVGNLNKLSKHYTKQSTFQGSRRQIRGQVLRLLAERSQTAASLRRQIDDERLESVLQDLVQEELLEKQGTAYRLHQA